MIGTKEKIDILLKEYDALRAEVMGRIKSRFTVVGYLIGLATFIGTQKEITSPIAWLLVSITFFVLVVWWRFWVLLKRGSTQIAVIEQKINHLAGEKLLTWEQAALQRDIFQKLRSKFQSWVSTTSDEDS